MCHSDCHYGETNDNQKGVCCGLENHGGGTEGAQGQARQPGDAAQEEVRLPSHFGTRIGLGHGHRI